MPNMPKLKTHKAISKRVKKTKTGKLKTRSKGQDHFNSGEKGKKTRNKRKDKNLPKSIAKSLKKYL